MMTLRIIPTFSNYLELRFYLQAKLTWYSMLFLTEFKSCLVVIQRVLVNKSFRFETAPF